MNLRTITKTVSCLIVALLIIGKTNARSKKEKVTIVGRFLITSSKPVTNKKVRIFFNERLWGKYVDKTDDSGFFEIKVPVGENFLAMVEYFRKGDFFKNLPEGYAHLTVEAEQAVWYVGDIALEWNISAKDAHSSGGSNGGAAGGAAGGIIGAIRDSKMEGEKLPLHVTANPATLAHFQQEFNSEIPTTLLEIEP